MTTGQAEVEAHPRREASRQRGAALVEGPYQTEGCRIPVEDEYVVLEL